MNYQRTESNSRNHNDSVRTRPENGSSPREKLSVPGFSPKQRPVTSPTINSQPSPYKLLQVDVRSVKDCILHFFSADVSTPSQNILIAGVKAIIENSDFEKITSVRTILNLSGYGFSTLYKYWPSTSNLFLDIWTFSVECYMASEIEHLRQLGRASPEQFINTLASHTVFAQQLVPPMLFSIVVDQFYDHDLLLMLDHIPGHVDNVLGLYDQLFGQDPSTPRITDELRQSLTNSAVLAGTYLFARNCKPKVPNSDKEIIESIKNLLIPLLSPRP